MSEHVYVVIGTCGEYSDRAEWCVVAFLDNIDATAYAAECDRIGKALVSAYDYPEGAHSLDPQWRTDYTGTDYHVVKVPFNTPDPNAPPPPPYTIGGRGRRLVLDSRIDGAKSRTRKREQGEIP